MGTHAFKPQGNTVAVAAGTSAALGVLVGPYAGSNLSPMNYMIANGSASTEAFLAWGTTPAEAQANAVLPSGATTSKGVILPNSNAITIRLTAGLYFSAITAAGTTTIYVCPGEGEVN